LKSYVEFRTNLF